MGWGLHSHYIVKPNLVLRLGWGFDNILSELELPPLLDPLESFEEFRNNFLESEAAKNEGFDSVETFEDLVKDFTHCTDDDVDIPLDENNMNQIYSC